MLQYELNRQCWLEMKQNKQSCFRRRLDDVTTRKWRGEEGKHGGELPLQKL